MGGAAFSVFFFFFGAAFGFDRPAAGFSFANSALSDLSFFFKLFIVLSFLDIFALTVAVALCLIRSRDQPQPPGPGKMLMENAARCQNADREKTHGKYKFYDSYVTAHRVIKLFTEFARPCFQRL